MVTGDDEVAKALFFELGEEKRSRIFEAGLREFSEQSYKAASTNNIVKAAGISKGSLFKYFRSKEDLYFYILDSIIADLVADIKDDISSLEGDVFDIILRYTQAEFNWHLSNPDKYRLIKRAFLDDNTEIYQKTADRYKVAGDSIYYNLLQECDTERLRWGREKTLNLIKWFIEGFNNDFMKKAGEFADISAMKSAYIDELLEYAEVLKQGVYK